MVERQGKPKTGYYSVIHYYSGDEYKGQKGPEFRSSSELQLYSSKKYCTAKIALPKVM